MLSARSNPGCWSPLEESGSRCKPFVSMRRRHSADARLCATHPPSRKRKRRSGARTVRRCSSHDARDCVFSESLMVRCRSCPNTRLSAIAFGVTRVLVRRLAGVLDAGAPTGETAEAGLAGRAMARRIALMSHPTANHIWMIQLTAAVSAAFSSAGADKSSGGARGSSPARQCTLRNVPAILANWHGLCISSSRELEK